MTSPSHKDEAKEVDTASPVVILESKTADQKPTTDDNLQSYSLFTTAPKRMIVLMNALAGFFSPFSAFIGFPAIEYLSSDLHVSIQPINVTVTMYLIVQGIIPAFFGDLADQIGRRPVYLAVLPVHLASCIGLALPKSYVALLLLRMLQSVGSSGKETESVSFEALEQAADKLTSLGITINNVSDDDLATFPTDWPEFASCGILLRCPFHQTSSTAGSLMPRRT